MDCMMSGVVHVGAHIGEELPDYVAQGRRPIICFEPQILIPFVSDGIQWVSLALSNRSGALALRIPQHLHSGAILDTQSASGLILIPENARANGWTPTPVEVITVPMSTFALWASDIGFRRGSCDLLCIDVQGMELQVLEGFGDYLSDFTHLKIECSDPPLYEGGASAHEVVNFLKTTFRVVSPIQRHGDIYFERR